MSSKITMGKRKDKGEVERSGADGRAAPGHTPGRPPGQPGAEGSPSTGVGVVSVKVPLEGVKSTESSAQ